VKVGLARVTETRNLYGNTYLTWFDAPQLLQGATPGTFLMLRCVEPGTVEGARAGTLPNDPFLPRPMSIHRVRAGQNGLEWAILYDVVGRGTAWLAQREPDDLVLGWGPLGRGYRVQPDAKQLLLVAGGIGIAPLVWLADEVIDRGKNVTLILGARSRDMSFPASELPPEVEVVAVTEDGSLGRRGLATDAIAEHLEWSDQVFACGPNAMFRTMAKSVRAGPRRPVQVLLEERMGCGTGICYGCTVDTRRKGMKLICKDGPMFELRDIYG
jgi:dihydroorotate dehydrogenase electron transfer subunit